MKFSEAIRAGRVKLEPFRGQIMDSTCTKGCALGMALAAVDTPCDIIRKEDGYDEVKKQWPWLNKILESQIPLDFSLGYDYGSDTLMWQIVKVWDDCVMRYPEEGEPLSEEQFFEWVEKLEEKYA